MTETNEGRFKASPPTAQEQPKPAPLKRTFSCCMWDDAPGEWKDIEAVNREMAAERYAETLFDADPDWGETFEQGAKVAVDYRGHTTYHDVTLEHAPVFISAESEPEDPTE